MLLPRGLGGSAQHFGALYFEPKNGLMLDIDFLGNVCALQKESTSFAGTFISHMHEVQHHSQIAALCVSFVSQDSVI
jgi:hypothetical protein